MRKSIIAALLVFIIIFLNAASFLTYAGEREVNPFSQMDKARNQMIAASIINPKASGGFTGPKTMGAYTSSPESENKYEDYSNIYVVQFKSSASYMDIYKCVSKYQFQPLAHSSERVFKVRLDDFSLFMSTYDDIIEYAEETKKREALMVPNDPLYQEQWALPTLSLPDAWDITTGSPDVLVGVIDTGIFRDHEDFNKASILSGYDFVRKRSNVTTDSIGHGTAVASVIAAATNNAVGLAGVSWNVSIIPYNVANSKEEIHSDDLIAAIRMAADAGCDVINISLGGYEYDAAEKAAIDYAVSKGSIVVAAAGNDGVGYRGRLVYPASYQGVISVGSINQDIQRSDFSQINSSVDVSAPGEDIIVATNNIDYPYGMASGTSLSSPYVAGIAALAKSMEKDIDWTYFDHIIKTTSTDLGPLSKDDYYGWGLINAKKVVNIAKAPIVMGVVNNGIYFTNVTIAYNKGTAYLNGVEISNKTTISNSGNYRLRVTDSVGNKTYVNFTIDKALLTVAGIENGKSYSTDRTITFSKGTATLNGVPFESGSMVRDEGNHTLILTGPNGNEASFKFTIDKTSPIVKGVEHGNTYNTSVKIVFNEGWAYLNGKKIESGDIVSQQGSHALVVTDLVGNKTNVDFTINKNASSRTQITLNNDLTQWIIDHGTDTLYAISTQGRSLLLINTKTMKIDKTVALTGAPTDIFKDDGKLYIALNDVNKIIEYDITNGSITRTINTVHDPFTLVKYENLIYYTQQIYSEIYEIDINTNVERRVFFSIYRPCLALNKELGILYIGSSGTTGGELLYYSIHEKEIIDRTYYRRNRMFMYPARTVLFDGQYVFYAGRVFNPESLTAFKGDYNDNDGVIQSKYGLAFTKTSVYNRDSHVNLGDLEMEAALIEGSRDGKSLFIYDGTNRRLVKYESQGPINNNNVIAVVRGTQAEGIPFDATGRKLSAKRIELSIGLDIKNWQTDDENGLLYAISQTQKALFFINSKTLDVLKTLHFTSGPTDIIMDNGLLYIPLLDANRIEIVDIAAQSIIDTIHTASSPYKIVKNGSKLYYAAYDSGSKVYELDMDNNTEEIIISSVAKPDLAINTDLNILYVGESGLTRVRLHYYSTTEKKIIATANFTDNGFYHKETLYDGEYVYYRGRALDPADPNIEIGIYAESPARAESEFYDRIILAKGNYAYSNKAIYDKYTFELIKYFDSEVELVDLSYKNDLYLYDKNKQIVSRLLGDRERPPVINGVENNKICINETVITFDKGRATLNGKPFVSGTKVSTVGQHILIVRADDCDDVIINFAIYRFSDDDNIPVVFKDDNFKQALLQNNVDFNNDGIITRGEMKLLHDSLSLSSVDINDISGIEYAVNLRKLDLGNNNIDNISALGGLTKLEKLDLSGNRISRIEPLSGLTKLKQLSLADNDILDIDALGSISRLVGLDISRNKISFIDSLESLIYLKSLNLADNEVGDIDSILFLRLNDLNISMNLLDLNVKSDDIMNINSLVGANILVTYQPQKSADSIGPLVITIDPYTTAFTNKNITVTASANRGRLNKTSHTFTSNGSFDFVATDSIGKTTVKTVTISNIDKTPPVFIIKSNNINIANGSTVYGALVTVSYIEANPDETSLKVLKDSNTANWPLDGIFTKEGSYKVSIKDKAGNTATINFIIKPPGVLGDTNGDGVIDVTDILRIRGHILGKSKLTGENLRLADVNGDSAINVTDILLIRAIILGK